MSAELSQFDGGCGINSTLLYLNAKYLHAIGPNRATYHSSIRTVDHKMLPSTFGLKATFLQTYGKNLY